MMFGVHKIRTTITLIRGKIGTWPKRIATSSPWMYSRVSYGGIKNSKCNHSPSPAEGAIGIKKKVLHVGRNVLLNVHALKDDGIVYLIHNLLESHSIENI